MTFSSNFGAFSKAMKKAKDQPARDSLIVHKKVILEALTRIVKRTPVDTGRARANWQATLNTPSNQSTPHAGKPSKPKRTKAPALSVAGSEAVARGLAVLDGLKPYSVFWISNNVQYVKYLESGGRMSKQAPRGMVAVTVEELKAMFGE
jgi:hypothetical protein